MTGNRVGAWSCGFLVVAVLSLSVAIGTWYAFVNIDPHHWGFIIGTILDVAIGKTLFKEVFIQYGPGQPLFFSAVNKLVALNYTNIGLFTVVVYALSLVTLFASQRKLLGLKVACLTLVLAFLYQPTAYYPWPDFYSGLFLNFAFLLLLGELGANKPRLKASSISMLLFLSFLFRSTYLVNIVGACVVYLAGLALNKQLRDTTIIKSISILALLVVVFFVWLGATGNLGTWFEQVTGRGYSSGYFQPWRAIFKAFDFRVDGNALFATLYSLNAIFLCLFSVPRFARAHLVPGKSMPALYFISALAATGPLQASYNFESFRLQNASGGIYLTSCYLLYLGSKRISAKCLESSSLGSLKRLLSNADSLVVISLVLMLIFARPNFPKDQLAETWPERAFSNLRRSSITLFEGHFFDEGENNYYEKISAAICEENRNLKIINLTEDSALPYLCGDSRSGTPMPFYSAQLYQAYYPQFYSALSKFDVSVLGEDVLLLSTGEIVDKNVRELVRVERPPIKYFGPKLVRVYRYQKLGT